MDVKVAGSNPDVDTRADLARMVEAAWGDQVRANREQVDRIREVPDGTDFYAPVRSMFRADPTRTGDPVLAELLEHVEPGDTWLDVGAGAGRFALPIARALAASGGSVIALDASASMLEAAREIAAEHGIENLQTIEASLATRRRGGHRTRPLGRRPHRACRLRRRGDRPVPRRDGGGGTTRARRGAHGADAGLGRGPVLAARPRGVPGSAAGPGRLRRAPGRPRSSADGAPGDGRAPSIRVARGARRLRPPAALDRSRRAQGGALPGSDGCSSPSRTARAGRSVAADRSTSASFDLARPGPARAATAWPDLITLPIGGARRYRGFGLRRGSDGFRPARHFDPVVIDRHAVPSDETASHWGRCSSARVTTSTTCTARLDLDLRRRPRRRHDGDLIQRARGSGRGGQ